MTSTLIVPSPSPAALPTNDEAGDTGASYAELKRLLEARGLLRPQPAYYTVKVITTLALLGVSLAILLFAKPLWLQLLNAVWLAFVFSQLGFLAHDVGHRQIVRRGWRFEALSLVLGNLLLGVSAGWWTDKHNAHHSHPNQDGMDPDIEIPVLAFSEAQARAMHGWRRCIGAYQAYLLVPLLFFQAFSMRFMGVRYLIGRLGWRAPTELFLLVVQLAAYGWLLLQHLNVVEALAAFAVTQALLGVALSAAFAPNHKGMPIVAQDSPLDFLHRQVLTARNVRGNPLIDFCMGGLNYQIEHHLAPRLPRNKLKAAQGVIREYCITHGIAYHETSLGRSYGEVFSHLHRMSRIVRSRGVAAS